MNIWFHKFLANPVTPFLAILLGNFPSPKVLSIVHTENLIWPDGGSGPGAIEMEGEDRSDHEIRA
jgi:hypothetical protein